MVLIADIQVSLGPVRRVCDRSIGIAPHREIDDLAPRILMEELLVSRLDPCPNFMVRMPKLWKPIPMFAECAGGPIAVQCRLNPGGRHSNPCRDAGKDHQECEK